jgi:ubiquinone/menaquinone biosynthesis C-methylase UbiE
VTPPLTEVERWLEEHVPPEHLESARAIYELMPSQSDRSLAWVYVPYDAGNESHWSDVARIADYVAHVPEGARRVLDVGPGDGWPSLPVARELPGVTVVGVDPSPLRTAVCRENAGRLELPNATFVTGDADALPFADGAFDGVMAASSLEEASNPASVFAELYRVLRPGGTLRASYQDWLLPAPELETVMLWDGREPSSGDRVLLYTYVRRVQEPAIERRYTLILDVSSEAEAVHQDGLVEAAAGRRAYGETLLAPGLGVPLLGRLLPHVRRSTVVEMRRWTTEWLVEALRDAGFASVRPTAFPGLAARLAGRDLITRGTLASEPLRFVDVATAIGRATGSLDGRGMVEAVR